ncbi:V-type proton ATPase subunit d, partial [Diplonema papillatum]|eukprot:gene4347-6731_t
MARRATVVDVQASAIRLEPTPNAGRDLMWYNFNDGGLEAMVQGYRSALLRHDDYNALCQCETLQDVKMYLQSNTTYGDPPFLQDAATLDPSIIKDKAQEKLVKEFNELREWADPPLSTFLDFITYDYMITNVLKLIQGARNNRETLDLITRMHPLGKFEGMGAIMADCSSID